MIYQGEVKNGVVVLEGGITLPDGTVVKVEILESPQARRGDDPVYCLAELAVPTGIADLAVNIDHYLYGHPKAADACD